MTGSKYINNPLRNAQDSTISVNIKPLQLSRYETKWVKNKQNFFYHLQNSM